MGRRIEEQKITLVKIENGRVRKQDPQKLIAIDPENRTKE